MSFAAAFREEVRLFVPGEEKLRPFERSSVFKRFYDVLRRSFVLTYYNIIITDFKRETHVK